MRSTRFTLITSTVIAFGIGAGCSGGEGGTGASNAVTGNIDGSEMDVKSAIFATRQNNGPAVLPG